MKTLEERVIERSFAVQMADLDPKWLRRELRAFLDDLIECREWRILAEVLRVMIDRRENHKLLVERARQKMPLTNLLQATALPHVSVSGSGTDRRASLRRPP